ncbi:hypothetical protein GOB57_09000 [Sinorhizobium meliloti]|nr:hypothetical protein [Sinorhizobium meliloti]
MFEDVARKSKYLVYSKKFDRECRIADLVDAETIERLEMHFELHRFEDHDGVEKGLQAFSGLDTGEDLQVSFLLDLSGSMQGRPIAEACYGVLAATLALEDLAATVEVLGYTTTGRNRPGDAFNGDRTINNPGRLSEALHVVAKPHGLAAARSAGPILAMATRGLNNENLDGEAIVWATNRLLSRPGGRKLLVLVTDGFEPGCALSERFAADRSFMTRHLEAVVGEIDGSDGLDFAQVIVDPNPLSLRTQTVYANPVTARSDAGDIVRAVGEAIRPFLAPKPAAVPAPTLRNHQ